MRTVAVLGATGSIGTQTLDLLRRYPDRFRAVALAGGSRADIWPEEPRKVARQEGQAQLAQKHHI